MDTARHRSDHADTAIAWHALQADAVLAAVGGSREGLSAAEAARRLAEHGPNRLTPASRRSALARFAAQFHNILIYVLLVAGLVTALLGHFLDSGVIVGVVVINALIGFLQEGRAERALEAIRDLLSPHAIVLRDGRRISIAAEELVPGDIVFLASGDKVPADMRVLRARNLRVQEAVLTGESVAVEKHVEAVPASASLGDRGCALYSGTLVAAGQGRGVVVNTGDATEIGRVSALLAQVETLTTPLLRQVARFGRWLTLAILAAAVLTFVIGTLVHGFGADEMFLAAVGLAVAAIPEGLPAIMTITLAIGVERMARRNAIIRRLPAVETLGSVSVICSDKTGTFTHNEMTVQTLACGTMVCEVTGSGYTPDGDLLLAGQPLTGAARTLPRAVALGALLCSDADLHRDADGWRASGDPMEAALLALAVKIGLDVTRERSNWPRLDEIPFESEHRFMATLHHDHAGHAVIHVKGAPERVLEMCTHEAGEDGPQPLDRERWQQRMQQMAERGERVLALATRSPGDDRQTLSFDDVDGGLMLLGLFGLADPPREEAIAAVALCHDAGLRVKMITGDHAVTALAIAARLGLDTHAGALTGGDIDLLDDATLASRASEVSVFARTSPEHKLRLVQALQGLGEVVAMTGDGVNDAPALKRADVGVAMGRKGAEAAKEAAEMVLADDNFASIAHAVEEGRIVYDNLKKALLFILPTNGGEALVIMTAVAFGTLLPITAVQILWVNMITAVTLALALAFESAEANVMARAPRRADEPLLSRFLLWRIGFVSTVLVAGVFAVFRGLRENGVDIETARTVAVNTLVLFEAFYLFNVRKLERGAFADLFTRAARPAWIAVATVLVFQLLFTYAPIMQTLFRTRPVSAAQWALSLAVAASVFALVELEKRWRRG